MCIRDSLHRLRISRGLGHALANAYGAIMENMIGWLGASYMPLEAAHVVITFFWIAGLFMLPRYLVHQASVAVGSPEDLNWRERTVRLRRIILTPSPVSYTHLLIHQQVAGFEVTMDHTLVVGMLHAMADVDEQGDALVQRQRMFFAIARHRRAVDELHGEVRETFRRGTGIVDLGDSRMAHLRQHLPLNFEVSQVTGVQALATQQFQGDGTSHRLQLFGTVDLSHATTTQQGCPLYTSRCV